MHDLATIVQRAWRAGTVIPGFNIPYLPMMAPVVQALRDSDSVGLIMVARLEWVKFHSGSLRAIREEYERVKDERHTRLHLDHVPVIDEDGLAVDYVADILEALVLGYDAVMVDGSRLSFDENMRCTRQIVELAHAAGVPVEAELGAVLGHETGPLPPYEELFASGKGFTDADEARRFVDGTGVDWLSVAIGNVHGAISAAARDQQKVEARLHIAHLDAINRAVNVPLGAARRHRHSHDGYPRRHAPRHRENQRRHRHPSTLRARPCRRQGRPATSRLSDHARHIGKRVGRGRQCGTANGVGIFRQDEQDRQDEFMDCPKARSR